MWETGHEPMLKYTAGSKNALISVGIPLKGGTSTAWW